MVTQINHQLSQYAAKNKVDTVICLRMGKTSKAKTPSGDFKVITLENSLLSQQAITSKGILEAVWIHNFHNSILSFHNS